MPLPKPKKDESQDDFVRRCMSEAFGDDAPADRTQEQAWAMCFEAWRNKDKAAKAALDEADLPEPEEDESKDDFISRCVSEVAAEFDDVDESVIEYACQDQWEDAGQDDIPDEEKAKRRKRRNNKRKLLAKELTQDDAPDPEDDEAYEEFMDRCIDELGGSDEEGDDEAENVCDAKWQDWERSSYKPAKLKAKKAKGHFDDVENVTADDCPEPNDDEDEDDYVERCVDELAGDFDLSAEDTDDNYDVMASACSQAFKEQRPVEDSHKPAKVKAKAKAIFAKRNPKMNKDIFDELDFPEPEVGENRDDYVDRCADEVGSDEASDGYSDDELVAGCDATAEAFDWDENDERVEGSFKPARVRQPTGITHFRTHAETVEGMEFVLSDETPDRMGDVISASGWDLDNFHKNPIALFNHNSNFPIGRWHNLRSDKGALRGRLEMAPKGTSDRIDEIRALIDAGILRAVSVGFRPLEEQPLKDAKGGWIGVHFLKQELVETSLVSVPANPNALAVAKSLNISPATIDFVFGAGSGKAESKTKRRRSIGGSAATRRNRRSGAMTLTQRITDIQAAITDRKEKLTAHWAKVDDSNVSDVDMQKTADLNAEIARLEKQHEALVASEKLLGDQTAREHGNGNGNGNGRSRTRSGRALALTTTVMTPRAEVKTTPNTSTLDKQANELDFLDLLVRGGTVAYVSKMWGKSVDETRLKIYGDDEDTKFVVELVTRAASAPAMTTVVGWAQELVQQTYLEMMPTLMPKGVLTRLAAKGLTVSFGRAGKINIPTRSRTPSIAGSFVGEGQAIPVRQGAFTSQALTPKKMAVITTWTREMDEHSIPAIEGILREAIQTDTTVAVDSVLLDANPATTIRPAGLLNGVAAQTPTAGGGVASVVGDIKLVVGALVTGTYGNIRVPVWLMNPAEMLSLSLISAANTGIFPFAAEVAAGNLRGIPIIDSGTVPPKTVVLIDAADFVVVGGEAPRFEMSDQATLHMEDTTPLDLVGPGSPGTVAAPQRSLFQTDSLALRMVMPLNWLQRRAGTIAWTQNVTW